MSIPIAAIQRRVADHFGITMDDLLGRRLDRRCARPRQVAMYLCRDYTGYSMPHIGAAFGRDHTTVMHAIIRVQQRIGLDPTFAEAVAAMRAELKDSPPVDIGDGGDNPVDVP